MSQGTQETAPVDVRGAEVHVASYIAGRALDDKSRVVGV